MNKTKPSQKRHKSPLNYGFVKITIFGEKDRVPSLIDIKNNMPLEMEARNNKEKSGDGSKIVEAEEGKPNDLETLLAFLKKKGEDFFVGSKSKTWENAFK